MTVNRRRFLQIAGSAVAGLGLSQLPTQANNCFSGGATRKYKVRSRPGGNKVQISPNEQEYQQSLAVLTQPFFLRIYPTLSGRSCLPELY